MGDVVAIKLRKRGSPDSSSCRLAVAPAWPQRRHTTLTIEQARAIDRDLRHLDTVMARARDLKTISTILSIALADGRSPLRTCGADRAARALNRFLVSGRTDVK